jgi:hypothetical protein
LTEIPLPPEGYEVPSAPKKGPGCGTMMIVGLVIAIVVVAGVIIVLLPGLGNGGFTTTTTTTSTSTTTTGDHSERELGDYRQDVDLVDTRYYFGGFSVSSSEVQTSTVPDLLFDIDVRDTGSDSVAVSIHIAVYEAAASTVTNAASWGDLSGYLVGEGTYSSPTLRFINLYNYASTYTWVIWFEASDKTDVWDVEIKLTLRYNWFS